MSLIWYNQGKWISNNNPCELHDGEKIPNQSKEQIFDLTVHDPSQSDNTIARVINGTPKVLRLLENGGSNIDDFYLLSPYIELKYNSKSGIESEHPLKISFKAKYNNLSDYGFLFSEGATKNYSLHIIRIKNDYKIINDTCEINYPFNFNEWFNLEMEFVNEYTTNDELPCNIKINDFCLGKIKWASPQRFPLRFYIKSNDGFIDITDLQVSRKIEETKPFKPLLCITKHTSNSVTTLTANAVIKEDEDSQL